MCRLSALDLKPSSPHDDELQAGPCPFTIRSLKHDTYLIKENDKWYEYPNIYARICTLSVDNNYPTASTISSLDPQSSSIIVVTDTGVGTCAPNHNGTASEPTAWTICSFLEHTINPGHQMPYLVITSHCHYDHILGLQRFLDEDQPKSRTNPSRKRPSFTVLSSAHCPSFLQPWSTLQRNSLCIEDKLTAPKYEIDIWAGDEEHIHYSLSNGAKVPLPITTFHTPGHTPDSLTWFDHATRRLFVGDFLYYRESPDSINAPWARESAAPIIFCLQSNVVDWLASIEKLLMFVRKQNSLNRDSGSKAFQRVTLSAGHASVEVDAEKCLSDAKIFMGRVLREEVWQFPLSDFQGYPRAHFTDLDVFDPSAPPGLDKISVIATVCVIEEARRKLLQPPPKIEGGKSRLDLKIRDGSIPASSRLRMNIVMRTTE